MRDDPKEDPFAVLETFLHQAPPVGPTMADVTAEVVELLREADDVAKRLHLIETFDGGQESLASGRYRRKRDALLAKVKERHDHE